MMAPPFGTAVTDKQSLGNRCADHSTGCILPAAVIANALTAQVSFLRCKDPAHVWCISYKISTTASALHTPYLTCHLSEILNHSVDSEYLTADCYRIHASAANVPVQKCKVSSIPNAMHVEINHKGVANCCRRMHASDLLLHSGCNCWQHS
jgi:hypothetical protein